MLQTIRGFYHHTVQRLANKRPEQLQDGTYMYCPADEALNDCRICAIQVYISRRRLQALIYVEGTCIYKLCQGSKQSQGTPSGIIVFWWEQDLSHWLDLNSYGAIVAQERRKVDCRDYATRRVLTKRAKCSRYEQSTLQIKGFMCGLSPYYFVKKNLPISPVG